MLVCPECWGKAVARYVWINAIGERKGYWYECEEGSGACCVRVPRMKEYVLLISNRVEEVSRAVGVAFPLGKTVCHGVWFVLFHPSDVEAIESELGIKLWRLVRI